MRKRKNMFLFFLLLLFSIVFIFAGNRIASKNAVMFLGHTGQYKDTDTYIVRVDTVLDIQNETRDLGSMEMEETKVQFSGTILFGERKGDTIVATQTFDSMTGGRARTPVKPGTWLFVYLTPETSDQYFSGEYFRLHYIIIIAVLFFLLLLVFGKSKGLATILALGLSVLAIFIVFIPAILSGFNIYFWAFLICLFTILINPYFIGGFNKKSTASVLGCAGGVVVAGVLTFLLNAWLQITGIVDEETTMVTFILQDTPIDLRALTFAAILIGALGATVDVSMSIATSINEMNETAQSSSFASLARYGMNIGRDIMGAQTSTLVLAYIGGSMSLTLLLVAYQNSITEMLNLEIVVIELLQMLIGGFTILFTIPATALVSAILFEKHGTGRGEDRDGWQRSKTKQHAKHRSTKPNTFRVGH